MMIHFYVSFPISKLCKLKHYVNEEKVRAQKSLMHDSNWKKGNYQNK